MYKPYKEVKLREAMINNQVIVYDVCSKNRQAYNEEVFSYIGYGFIYKIDGIKQSLSVEPIHFWTKRDTNE